MAQRAAQSKTEDEGLNLSALARECLAKTQDIGEAVASLVRLAKRRPEVMSALMDGALEDRAHSVVRRAMADQRRSSWGPPTPSNSNAGKPRAFDRSVYEQMATVVSAGILATFRLPQSGIVLGDATREEVLEAIEFYRGQSATLARRAKWLELIVQGLQPREKVSKRITDERAAELQQLAANEEN